MSLIGLQDVLRDRVAAALLLIAVLVRLAFGLEVVAHDLDLTGNDQLDMVFLHENARRIAAGDVLLREPYLGNYRAIRERLYGPERYDRLYGRHTYVDSPGYLYFAGAVERVWASPYAVVAAQLALDALGCALVYVLARRALGLAGGRLALALAALTLECVAEAGFVLRESVIAFLATWSTLALDTAARRDTPRSWLAAGAVFGLGWITKLSFALAVPFVVLAGRKRPRHLVVFALGALLPVLPFAARNVALGVPPFRMSSTAIQVIVNRNMAGYSGAAEFIRQDQVRAIIERSDETTLGAWLEAVKSHPRIGDYAAQLGRKVAFFWAAIDFWNNIRSSYLRELSPTLGLLPVWWGVLGPWSALGLALAIARRRELLPVLGTFLALGLGAALTGGVYTRYRMVVEPVACVLAAAAMVEVAALLVRRRLAGVVLLALALGLHVGFADWRDPLTRDQLRDYVRGTWPSPRARLWLLERCERSARK